LITALVAVLALLAWASTAHAAEPSLLTRFCEPGTEAGQCKNPQGMVANPQTGDVYVVDTGNHRIDVFDPWGTFLEARGWGVRDGSPEAQTCGPEADSPSATCLAGIGGGGPGQLNEGAKGLALDSEGSLYLYESSGGWKELPGGGRAYLGNNRVQKFDPEGDFALAFGREVDLTKVEEREEEEAHSEPVTVTRQEEDLCTASSGDTCQGGVRGSGPGEFGVGLASSHEIETYGSYIATAPDDTVYVGGAERVQEFNPDGTFKGLLPDPGKVLVGEMVQSLAVDPVNGDLYVVFFNGDSRLRRTTKEDVLKLSPAGEVLSTVAVSNPTALATDGGRRLYASDSRYFSGSGGDPANHSSRVFEFDSSGNQIAKFDEAQGGEAAGEEANFMATNSGCGIEGSDLYVHTIGSGIGAYGPVPDPSVCPPPAVPPSIDAQYATFADSASAGLKAKINPHFWPDTRYYLEYGTGRCSEGGCSLRQPAAPGASLTKQTLNGDVTTPGVFLDGLEAATTYHYRFVAASGGGGPVRGLGGTEAEAGGEGSFHTALPVPATNTACPNRAYRGGPSAKLPDCRAYEMVSPLEKNNGDVFDGEEALSQAAGDGERMAFSSATAFAEPQSSPLIDEYLAERREGEGWATRSISPPRTPGPLYLAGGVGQQYGLFGEDLCSGWLVHDSDNALAPEAPPGVPNLYRRESCGTGEYELLTSTPPPGFSYSNNSAYFPEIQGASADGSRSVFRADAPLAVGPGGPRPPLRCVAVSSGPAVAYAWLRNGEPIAGATKPTYTPGAEDEGTVLQCRASVGDEEGASLAASEPMAIAPTPETAPPDPGDKGISGSRPGAPLLTGTPAAGQTLSCVPANPWRHDPTFSYRWLRNGKAIAGASAAAYELQGADVGAAVQCELSGTNAGGTVVLYSEAEPIQAHPPAPSAAAAIGGTAAVGQPLTCGPGTWSGSPSFAYQWLRNAASMSGAEDIAHGSQSATYTVQAADEGKALQCRVTATNSDGAVQAASAAVVVPPEPGTAPPALKSAPTLAGAAQLGETLSCNAGAWSGEPSFARKWLRDGTPTGAGGETVKLGAADLGKSIQCQVTATNAGGAVAAISAARYVAPVPPEVTAASRPNGYDLFHVYEAHDGGKLRLIDVRPDGSVPNADSWVGAENLHATLKSGELSVYHAVSEDGERVFWASASGLYLRVNASEAESARLHGAARGSGNLIGPATGIGNVISGSTTISSVKETSGAFTVGQEITGTGIQAATTIVGVETGKLKISKPATANKAGVELSGLASAGVTGVQTESGAFTVGQEIAGTGIAAETTIVAVGAGTLTLSAKATKNASGATLSATSPCLEATRACTIAISEAPDVRFLAADPTGRSLLYTVGKVEGHSLDLYEARIEEAGGGLVAVSQPIASGLYGVMGASEDLSRIYLASRQALGGAGQNSFGEEAVAEEPNLYFYEAGAGFSFVATLGKVEGEFVSTLSSAAPSAIALQPNHRLARVSPDGLHAAFTTTASLGEYDNTDQESGEADGEVYRYAASPGGEGRLACLSCNPSGARPRGREAWSGNNGNVQVWLASLLPGWVTGTHPGGALSANGNRVFFESYDALRTGDTNGRADVYEWEAAAEGDCTESSPAYSEANGGCLSLISSGQSPEDSRLLDADSDGANVFFATGSSLVAVDYGLRDVYDARVEGGFPVPEAQAGCEGEACQGTPEAPNDPTPASESFQGAGNVHEEPAARKPKHCAKGKVKRHGRCVKRHKHRAKKKHRKRSHKRRAHAGRRAAR